MTSYSTELGTVVYNPQTRAYEALVTFREGAHVERYPCALRFPMDAAEGVVANALVRQARLKRNRTRVPLRSCLSRLGSQGHAGQVSRLA